MYAYEARTVHPICIPTWDGRQRDISLLFGVIYISLYNL